MEIKEVEIEKPEDMNFILGQTHFIKSVEDLYEAMINVPNAKFGIAFCEASGPCLVRADGNDEGLKKLAINNATSIGAGHSFIILMEDCYPVNVLNAIKNVPEVCSIYCATANPVKVLIAESNIENEKGRAIIGVIDGYIPKGVESEDDIKERNEFLRKIGYKR
ncbi:MAG: adenosine-specific kinase [Candidatus Thermoplasmatota archaeon]|nr:adenosine-specific kinase [Candidatus Thermoplasmatota archaeon]